MFTSAKFITTWRLLQKYSCLHHGILWSRKVVYHSTSIITKGPSERIFKLWTSFGSWLNRQWERSEYDTLQITIYNESANVLFLFLDRWISAEIRRGYKHYQPRGCLSTISHKTTSKNIIMRSAKKNAQIPLLSLLTLNSNGIHGYMISFY